MKKIQILLSLFLIIAFFVFVVTFSSQVSAWGASNEHDSDMDCLDDNPNTPDNPDGSCDECGNGGWYDEGGGGRSCTTVSCYSAPNVCGWINEGTMTVCGSSRGSSGVRWRWR